MNNTNQLLSAILESSPEVIVFALDKNYCYLTYNKKHKEIMRKIWGVEIEVGMNMLYEVISNPEDRIKAKEGFDRALAGESFVRNEEYGDEKYSRQYWQIYWSPIFSDDGEIVGLTCYNLDITERKQAEKRMQESEQRFQKMLSLIPDMISIHDTDMNIVYSNWNGFGAVPQEKRVLNTKCYWTYRGLDHICPDCQAATVLQTKEAIQKEVELPEGNWVDLRVIPIIGKDGSVELLVEWVRDITSQKQAEQDIQNLVENAPDMVLRFNTELQSIYCNAAVEHYFGTPKEYFLGKTFPEFTTIIGEEKVDAFDKMADTLRQCLDTQKEQRVELCFQLQGEVKYFSTRVVPEFNRAGQVKSLLAVTRDTTARKLAEEQLKESEQRLETLISQTPAIIYSYKLINGVPQTTYINENIRHVLGFEPEDFINNFNFFKGCLHPEDFHKVFDAIPKLMAEGRVTLEEYRFKDNQGHYRWLHDEQKLITHEDGTLEVIGAWWDITERKQAEENIRYMSFHDSLTGLYNRYFLEEEMKRLDTERQLPISIIMADLDGLKLVNDAYGHTNGDEMLKTAAGILKKSCREEDVIARWGGDEFLILLPQTTIEEAGAIQKRIKANCKEVHVQEVPVSLSVGYACKKSMDKDLTEVLREAESDMYKRKLTESRSTKSGVLKTLLITLEEKSHETRAHIQRMDKVSRRIAEKLALPDSEMDRLALFVSLHDIGKINISEDILTKKGTLTKGEWGIIKEHSEIGYRITRATEEFSHVAEDILAHHERWDGSGYPQGLKREKIPLLARILAIADAYEVMCNGRSYKEPMTKEEIVAEFKKCSGTQFDPQLVEIFLSMIA